MKPVWKILLILISISGLFHCFSAARSWYWYVQNGTEGGYRGYRILHNDWYFDALPTIMLSILFLLALIIAFRSIKNAGLILIWVLVTGISFWYYDCSNHNFQAYANWPNMGLGHSEEKWDYANWRFYSNKWDTERWGFIDKTGKFVIPPSYHFVDSFSEGLAAVAFGKWWERSWGFIDKTGKLIIPIQYKYVNAYSEGVSVVNLDVFEDDILINKKGQKLCDIKSDTIGKPSEGLVSFRYSPEPDTTCIEYTDPNTPSKNSGPEIPKTYGFMDYMGKVIIEPVYSVVYDFNEGLAAVKKGSKWGFINKSGKAVINFEYDSAAPFREGLAFVKINEKWGCIDTSNKWIMQPTSSWSVHSSFWKGYAVIKSEDKYGMIDKTGNIVLEPEYKYIHNQPDQGRIALTDHKGFYLDENLQIFLEHDWIKGYEWIGRFSEGFATFSKGRKRGYLNKEGKVVITPGFHDNRPFSEGLAAVSILKWSIGRYVPICIFIVTGLGIFLIAKRKPN